MYTYLCLYACTQVCVYVCMSACICMNMERERWMDIHAWTLMYIHTYRSTAKRSASRSRDGPAYPPCRNYEPQRGRPVCAASSSGADSGSGGPAPLVCAAAPAVGYSEYSPWGALRTHQGTASTHTCGMRRTGANSVRCAIAWRVRVCGAPPMSARRRSAAKCVGVLRVVLCVLARGTVSTHTCSMLRCARAIHRLDRRLRWCRRTCSLRRRGRDAGRCARKAVHAHSGCSRVSPVRPHAAESHPSSITPCNEHGRCKQTAILCTCNGPERADPQAPLPALRSARLRCGGAACASA